MVESGVERKSGRGGVRSAVEGLEQQAFLWVHCAVMVPAVTVRSMVNSQVLSDAIGKDKLDSEQVCIVVHRAAI